MEKEFVPYELAVKLKELGFDKDCFACYTKDGELSYDFSDNRGEGHYFQECSAPTFSQAFRWFRDKYGLKSWIEGTMGGNYIYEIRPHNLADYKEGEVYVYATYEETELNCLNKLIEIVESKSK